MQPIEQQIFDLTGKMIERDWFTPQELAGVRQTAATAKPPVTPPASAVTEVIVDSEPTSLDYDDNGGSGAWATTTFSGSPSPTP